MWKYRHPDELYHYGILGMKWGKRNGPPYPLSETDKSAAEKRAQRKSKTRKAKTQAAPSFEPLVLKRNLKIWGRNFDDFEIIFDDLPYDTDTHRNQLVTKQRSALNNFLKKSDASLTKAKKTVFNYVEDLYRHEHAENPIKGNIFSFVRPKSLFVSHDEKPAIGMLCDLKYDPEHGLGIRFYDDGKIEVGGEGDVGLF